MKKIIRILLICLIIAGTIVISTIGFNVGIKYSANTQISINMKQEFNVQDVKKIAKEVFKNQPVLVQQVEIYKDMAQITVKEASEEQINELNQKINEKYGLENKIEDLYVTNNSNVKLKTIANQYKIPIAIVSIIVILYAMALYRKLGIWKVLYTTALNMIVPQTILFSVYAVTRLPINRATAVISIMVYISSIILSFVHLSKKKNELIEK